MSDTVYNSLTLGVLFLFIVIVLVMIGIPILNKLDYRSGANGEILIRVNKQTKKIFVMNSGINVDIKSDEKVKYYILLISNIELYDRFKQDQKEKISYGNSQNYKNMCEIPDKLNDYEIGIKIENKKLYILPCRAKICESCMNIEEEKLPVICDLKNLDKLLNMKNGIYGYNYLEAVVVCRNLYEITSDGYELKEAKPIIYVPLH